MFRSEVYKLLQSRFIIFSVLLMLLANFMLIVYQNRDAQILPEPDMDRLIADYVSDPAAAYEYYDRITSPEYLPENDSKLPLYVSLFGQINYIRGYKPSLEKIISTAERTMVEYDATGISPENFSYRYQKKLIAVYSCLKNDARLGLEYARGWDLFFTYRPIDIFVFITIIIVSSYLFVLERRCNTTFILRSTRNGQIKLALCKVGCLVTLIPVVSFMFILTTSLGFGLIYGYSSMNNAIQIFSEFQYCPYLLTVGGYLVRFIVIKLIAYLLFSLIVMLLSIVISNYAVMCFGSACVYILNIALNSFRYTNSNNPLKIINLVSVTAVTPLYERYRAFDLFGEFVNVTSFTVVLYLSLIFVLAIMIVFSYCHFFTHQVGTVPAAVKKLSSLAGRIKGACTSKCIRRTHMESSGSISLFRHEFYKMMIATKYIWLVILLLILKVNLSNLTMKSIDSYSERRYYEYMTILSQKTMSEQDRFLLEERSRIELTLEKYDEMRELYAQDKISYEEYSDYLLEYNYASANSGIFNNIERHKDYINAMSEAGYYADFVYDTGWKQLLIGDFDWTLFMALALICSNIFACEYDKGSSNDGFAQILRTTKQGRNRTIVIKYLALLLFTISVFAVWNAVDFCRVSMNYELPCISSSIQSIESFAGFLPNISIGGYLVCYYMTKLAAAIILASLVFALSAIMHRVVQVIIITSAVTILPMLLGKIGFPVLSEVDFAGLMTATPMLRRNFYILGYLAACIGFCVGLNYYAWRRWNHGVKYKKRKQILRHKPRA